MNRNLALVAVAVVAIAGAAYFATRPSRGPAKVFTARGACLACQTNDVTATFSKEQDPPFECSQCKKAAVFPWYYCDQCKKRFVPAPDYSSGQPRRPTHYACPQCKREGCGDWIPEMPGQANAPAQPLPKLR